MKSLKIIEKHLKRNFKLSALQMDYELSRFVRHPDVERELARALKRGRFPKKNATRAVANGESYTAEVIYNKYANTIYASYSLLTQIREDPKIAVAMTEGFKIK